MGEMLVGHSPFSSALTEKETKNQVAKMDLSTIWSSVPGSAQPLLKALLRRDPKDRMPLIDTLEDTWLVSFVGDGAHKSAKKLAKDLEVERQERDRFGGWDRAPFELRGAGENDLYQFFCDGMQGNRPYMEDRTLACLTLPGHNHLALFGVFDGHGGEEVADLSARIMQKALAEALAVQPELEKALERSFEELDKELLGYVERQGFALAGTTAVMCLLARQSEPAAKLRLLCANCGDSRAILCRDGKAFDLSTDHKPTDVEEEKRITAAGGTVKDGRINGDGLNVSRTLGDFSYKGRLDLLQSAQQVSAVPEVRDFVIEDKDEFLVLCTDGVLDMFSSEKLIQRVREGLQQGLTLEQITSAVLKESIASNDNVSLCIVKLVKPTSGGYSA